MIAPSCRLVLALALATVPFAGCYTYVPSRLESVPIGSVVRAFISTEAALALDQTIGTGTGPLAGTLVERNDERILMLVRGGVSSGWLYRSGPLYQRVDVAVPDVLRVDRRVTSKLRTGGLIAALLGAVTVAIVTAVGDSEPGSPPPPGGTPVE